MSNICGLVSFDRAPVDVQMLRTLAEPAMEGLTDHLRWRACGEAGLATTGDQLLGSRDDVVWLAGDLRLDNRSELSALLHPAATAEGEPSDAALVLAAYLRWGTACPERLLGDFAFAVWDPRERWLFCARDPLGIKPLHWARIGALVCVASEPQQILAHPAVPLRLDEETIADYLANLADDRERSFFRDVRQVPSGCRLVSTREGDRIERFWDVDPERRIVYRNESEYAAHFLDLFEQCVATRLQTQGRAVGIAMSGGLDSTSIAAVARRRLPRGGVPDVMAFSLVFDRLRDCDERELILEVQTSLDLEAELINAEPFWLLGDPEAYRPRLETPFLAWESSFQAMMDRMQKHGVNVLLTGFGGDDLMAGSILVYADRLRRGDLRVLGETGRYAVAQGRSWWRALYRYFGQPLFPRADRVLRRFLGKTRGGPFVPDWMHPDLVRRTGVAERLAYVPARHSRGRAWQEFYDETVLFQGWICPVHWYRRNAAPRGVEVRHPFLDRRLVELLLAIPQRRRSLPGCYKPLLRQAMAGLLPENVRLRRDKTRFDLFIDLGLRHNAREIVEKLLTDSRAADLGLIDGASLRAAYSAYQSGSSPQNLWPAITLEVWLRGLEERSRSVRTAAASRRDSGPEENREAMKRNSP